MTYTSCSIEMTISGYIHYATLRSVKRWTKQIWTLNGGAYRQLDVPDIIVHDPEESVNRAV
jgi:hypothetical protein